MELITKEKFYELMEEYSECIFWQKISLELEKF